MFAYLKIPVPSKTPSHSRSSRAPRSRRIVRRARARSPARKQADYPEPDVAARDRGLAGLVRRTA
jgi:hypothetical protein